MASGGVSGKSLAITGVGVVLAWSGLRGKKISTTMRDLVYGKNPSDNTTTDLPVDQQPVALEPFTGQAGAAVGGAFGPGAGGTSPAASGSGGAYTFADLESLAQTAGFNAIQAPVVAAIALAESTGHAKEINNNPSTGDLSYGLMQINMIGSMGPSRLKEFGLTSNDQLLDPLTNMRAAYMVSNHGTNFTPWTTYTSGKYRKYLP